jgi:hypothetical protein
MTALRQGLGAFVRKLLPAHGAYEFLKMNPLRLPAVVVTRRAIRITVFVPVHGTVIAERVVFPLFGFGFQYPVFFQQAGRFNFDLGQLRGQAGDFIEKFRVIVFLAYLARAFGYGHGGTEMPYYIGHKAPPCGWLFVVIQLYHIEGLYIFCYGGFYEEQNNGV